MRQSENGSEENRGGEVFTAQIREKKMKNIIMQKLFRANPYMT